MTLHTAKHAFIKIHLTIVIHQMAYNSHSPDGASQSCVSPDCGALVTVNMLVNK